MRLAEQIRYDSDKKRKKIVERDGYSCVICDSTDNLEVHHKLAIYLGGTADDENLVTLCKDCHKRAPETGDKDFKKYRENPFQNVWDRMLQSDDVREKLKLSFLEYAFDRIDKYHSHGLISTEQMMKAKQLECELVEQEMNYMNG